MRIISKYKDYYDYLVGKYGMDPLIIYDRTESINAREIFESEFEEVIKEVFYICNEKYTLHYYRGDIYHTLTEVVKLNDLLDIHGKEKLFSTLWRAEESALNYWEDCNGKTNKNSKHNTPILKHNGSWGYRFKLNDNDDMVQVKLSDYGFASIIPAEEMWLRIYTFISKTKDINIENDQTNIEKVESHGFDKKRSFRPKMKK